MTRSRLVTVAIVGLAAAASALLGWRAGAPWIDRLFLTVIGSGLGLVLRRAVAVWLAAARSRRRAAELAGTEPVAAALAAVREERRRLSEDITASLREALQIVQTEAAAAAAAADPRQALARIREHTRLATSELRRQLGLLRHEESAPLDAGSRPPARALARRDVAIAGIAVALAVTESLVYPELTGAEMNPLSVLLSALVAATVLARGTLPALAALIGGALYLVGILLQVPVPGGFWFLISVAGVIWTICAWPTSGWLELAAALFLAVASELSTWLLDRDNAAFVAVVLGVAGTGGLAVRWGRLRAGTSQQRADRRQQELDRAASLAVAAERRGFARELHDVMSHAVGLIAVQAGAADISWPADPAQARRSISIIGRTAVGALAELDRLVPQPPGRPLAYAQLIDLVQRIRLAGTPVRLRLDIDPTAPLDPAAYRVVQEALTNVVRHAPGATARVSLGTDGDGRTRVEVADDGAGTELTGRGYGLVGLAERVTLAGGAFEAGTAPDGGGFRVVAVLPSTLGALA
jgi:signal transduction histidine kinase